MCRYGSCTAVSDEALQSGAANKLLGSLHFAWCFIFIVLYIFMIPGENVGLLG